MCNIPLVKIEWLCVTEQYVICMHTLVHNIMSSAWSYIPEKSVITYRLHIRRCSQEVESNRIKYSCSLWQEHHCHYRQHKTSIKWEGMCIENIKRTKRGKIRMSFHSIISLYVIRDDVMVKKKEWWKRMQMPTDKREIEKKEKEGSTCEYHCITGNIHPYTYGMHTKYSHIICI